MKKLTRLLIVLLSVATMSGGVESQTLYDQVQRKAWQYELNPRLVRVQDDPEWIFKGNKDYEVYIDLLITACETTPLQQEVPFYLRKETWGLGGFLLGFWLTR